MKNKVITGVVILVVLGILISLGYIILNTKPKDPAVNQEDPKKEITENKEEENKGEEHYQNVVLNSKVGNEILATFTIRSLNFYSDELYDEITKNGLTDKTKLMYTYLVAVTNQEYEDLFKTSEEGNYIMASDLDQIAKKIFGNQTKLTHQAIYKDTKYDAQKACYFLPAVGFGGMNLTYTLEIPLEIREYNNKVTVTMQRVYLTMIAPKEEENIAGYIEVYLDRNRTSLFETIKEEAFIEAVDQTTKIGEDLAKAKLKNKETVTYTLEKENTKYYIKDITK